MSALIESIIAGAEERIFSMTGMNVRLEVIKNTPAELGFLDRLGEQLANAWGVSQNTFRVKSRKRDVVAMKQVYCYLAKILFRRDVTLKQIGDYLDGVGDHSVIKNRYESALDMLSTQEPVFMSYYNKAKLSWDASTTEEI